MPIDRIKLPDNTVHELRDNTKQEILVSGENIKTINNESLLGSGNITVPDEWADLSDILIAVYGTTTSAEVEAAITAGKAIYVKRSGLYVPFARSLNGYYEFTKSDSGSNYTIKLRQSNNAWSESVTYVPTSSSSKTITTAAPSSSSTDSQVPTSKAVYTGLSGKEDTANKVTSLSSSSTDTEYPSAKCVYDAIQAGGGGSVDALTIVEINTIWDTVME